MYYLINQHGQFVSSFDAPASELPDRTPPGHEITVLAPPRTTDYWNGSSWIAVGGAPAYYFRFDYATKQWVDTRDITLVRQEKWNQIKMDRNRAEFGGFTYEDMKFDSDQIAQGRMLAAYMFNQTVSWTLANDEVVLLSVEQIQAVALAMAQHVQSVHEKARLARELINSAETIAEVEAVRFNG